MFNGFHNRSIPPTSLPPPVFGTSRHLFLSSQIFHPGLKRWNGQQTKSPFHTGFDWKSCPPWVTVTSVTSFSTNLFRGKDLIQLYWWPWWFHGWSPWGATGLWDSSAATWAGHRENELPRAGTRTGTRTVVLSRSNKLEAAPYCRCSM